MKFFSHQHSPLPNSCSELRTLNKSDLVITPLNKLHIIMTNRTLVFTRSLPTLFHMTLPSQRLVLKCPKTTVHKEFASGLLQILQRKELFTYISEGPSYIIAGGTPTSPSWCRAPPGLQPAKVLTGGGDLREAQVDVPPSVCHSCV